VARLFLGIMAGMAVLGLVYALFTKDFRRANDKRKGRPGEEAPLVTPGPRTTPPAELAGLGYLPADSAVVAGLHLAELLHDPEGKQLWEKVRGGPAGPALKFVEDRTGLKPEEIDHLVLGASPGEGPPGLVVVVRTVRPYSSEALARALEPAKPLQFRGRPVYRFQLSEFIGHGLLFRASDDTLVMHLGLLPAALGVLDAIPASPRKGSQGLPPTVRSLLADKLERGSLVWTVGSLDDLPAAADLARLGGAGGGNFRTFFGDLRAFSAGMRLQSGVTLGAALQGKDERASRELAALLEKDGPQGVDSFKVLGPGGKGWTKEQGDWVLVQVRAGPGAVAELLARGMPGGARP
jgi:hypothetical protein